MMKSQVSKLMTQSGPIDRVAARVVKTARREDVWRPEPKLADHAVESKNALPTKEIPRAAAHMQCIIGSRRDRLMVVGYAADQGGDAGKAKWVCRCDCGNYVQRTRIMRWLATKAADQCRECHDRLYRIRGWTHGREKAVRGTPGLGAEAQP